MIGMMNNHQVDNPVEFYAGRRYLPTLREDQQLQIQLAPVQKKLSYTEEGRRLVDGEPEESDETPNQMWGKLMLKISCNKAIEGEHKRRISRMMPSQIHHLHRFPPHFGIKAKGVGHRKKLFFG
jgi:hypothetical protein